METDFPDLWAMHRQDAAVTHDKLVLFLCGWMGGPRRYAAKYGPISIPLVHGHLRVTEVERDQWLACMGQALAAMAYPGDLQEYLLQQLGVPAERVRQYCTQRQVNKESG